MPRTLLRSEQGRQELPPWMRQRGYLEKPIRFDWEHPPLRASCREAFRGSGAKGSGEEIRAQDRRSHEGQARERQRAQEGRHVSGQRAMLSEAKGDSRRVLGSGATARWV